MSQSRTANAGRQRVLEVSGWMRFVSGYGTRRRAVGVGRHAELNLDARAGGVGILIPGPVRPDEMAAAISAGGLSLGGLGAGR